jgi:hypothetical protein
MTLLAIAFLGGCSGCGYTVVHGPESGPAQSADEDPVAARDTTDVETDEHPALPPGHPLLIDPDEWIGRSFLDDIVGESDPLRFENVRREIIAPATLAHAVLTLRLTVGGPAVSDVWQIHMDEFGWVTVARWLQASSGPELDEGLAADRVEFRLERASEAALRQMIIALLPGAPARPARIPHRQLRHVPPGLWPYENPGLVELDYRVETLQTVGPQEWPGGRLSAPLDFIQLLIGTWDEPPAIGLQQEVWRLAQERPSLVDLATVIEGLVLACEVEGPDLERIHLPLWIGR